MTTHAAQMLRAHPKRTTGAIDELAAAIDACFDCAEACSACADACLAEQEVHALIECIRTNIDCAEVCTTTARLLARQTAPGSPVIKAQLAAAIAATQACAAACDWHGTILEHCRVCAEACKAAQAACEKVLRLR